MNAIALHWVFCISFGYSAADILMTSSLFPPWVNLAQNMKRDFATECCLFGES
jgi:hypothetical protein